MKIKNIVNCPFCHEGQEFNANSGVLVRCKVCQGTGILTPENICNCGRSCTTIIEEFATCGDADCLKELKRKAANESFNSWGPYGGHRHM